MPSAPPTSTTSSRHPGYRQLTTQINFTGDKYLHTDFAFGTRDELIVTLERVTDAAGDPQGRPQPPFARATFDIVLTKEEGQRAAAPWCSANTSVAA